MNKRTAAKRTGTSATEVVVAATLLLSMIGLLVPTTVRTGHIWRDSRHYQIATHELSNQFEYLSTLDEAQRTTALANLKVSEQTSQSLLDADLKARLTTTADGVRLILSLNWDRGVDAKPLEIEGWIYSMSEESPKVQAEIEATKEAGNEAT